MLSGIDLGLMTKRVVPWLLVLYLMLNANARIQPSSETFKYFSFFNISRVIGLTTFEWIFLAVIWSVVLLDNHREPIPWWKSFRSFGVLVVLSMFSVVVLSYPKMVGIRTVFDYIQPFIIFLIVAAVDWDMKDARRIFRILAGVFILNLVVSYIQMIGFGWKEDNLSGLMDNAHVYVFMMYTMVIYFLMRYWKRKKKKYLFMIVLVMVPALVASADKMTIFLGPTILVLYFITHEVSTKKVIQLVAWSVIVLAVVVITFIELPTFTSKLLLGDLWRFEPFLVQDPIGLLSNVRIIQGYTMLPLHYFQYPYSPFIGVGPGMYGSQEVIKQFVNVATGQPLGKLTNSPLKNFALGGDYTLYGFSPFQTGTTSFASSDFVVIFLEFGLVFAILYFRYWKNLWNYIQNWRSRDLPYNFDSIFLTILGVIIFLGFLGLITFQDGVVKTSNVFPAMMMLGVLFRALPDRSKNKHADGMSAAGPSDNRPAQG